jgi:hypothetical protein
MMDDSLHPTRSLGLLNINTEAQHEWNPEIIF